MAERLTSGKKTQLWVLEEGVLKTATKDFYVTLSSQDSGAAAILTQNPDKEWSVNAWGWLFFFFINNFLLFCRQ